MSKLRQQSQDRRHSDAPSTMIRFDRLYHLLFLMSAIVYRFSGRMQSIFRSNSSIAVVSAPFAHIHVR
jgi:hypothetical protein